MAEVYVPSIMITELAGIIYGEPKDFWAETVVKVVIRGIM
jgi:hypothetical protein